MSQARKRNEPSNGVRRLRPVDLARAVGLSAQSVRNYEDQGVIAHPRRTPSGYRAHDQEHLDQLLAFTALARAIGHQDAAAIMTAVTDCRTNDALEDLDRAHAQLEAGRGTVRELEAVLRAADRLPLDDAHTCRCVHRRRARAPRRRHTGDTARLGGRRYPAPRRHQNGHREYISDDALDARVAALLRRGDFPLASIAAAIDEIHQGGDASTALARLHE